MKRIFFFFFLMILFCTSISWAEVNYTSVDFGGILVADDNPIVRVLNSDGTHRATSKATLRGLITVNCTVSARSYGTLDIAITGSIRKGDTDLDTVAGAQNYLIGAGPWLPISVAERRSAYGRNSNSEPYDPAYETDQTGTYVLNGKATITRSGGGGANSVEYLGVGVGVSDSTTYASQMGQQIDSVVITMTTQTLGDSVSGNACRSIVISSSGAVSLGNGCEGNGTCPTRSSTGGLQRRHGRCGGDGCNCNHSSTSSTDPPSGNPDPPSSSSGCSQHTSVDYCNDQGTCTVGSGSGVPGPICGENYCCCPSRNGSTPPSGGSTPPGGTSPSEPSPPPPPPDNTPNCPDCTSDCSSPCSCTNSGTCGGTVSTPPPPPPPPEPEPEPEPRTCSTERVWRGGTHKCDSAGSCSNTGNAFQSSCGRGRCRCSS